MEGRGEKKTDWKKEETMTCRKKGRWKERKSQGRRKT